MQSMPYRFLVSYVRQQFGFMPSRFNQQMLNAAYQAFLMQFPQESQLQAPPSASSKGQGGV